MADIYDVADWFLSKESMTHKKIQKLSYYYQAWGYALYNREMIENEEFEAWVHGPVSRKLFSEYTIYGWNDIPQKDSNDNLFSKEELNLLESVWVTYGDKSANELEALTHSEMPWIKARVGYGDYENCSEVISPDDMGEYYKSIYIGD